MYNIDYEICLKLFLYKVMENFWLQLDLLAFCLIGEDYLFTATKDNTYKTVFEKGQFTANKLFP